jgi:hypothetical protein
MKKILLLTIACICTSWLSAQFIYKIKADSVLITNDSCTAELNLENSTKHVLGFLYNKGNGRTEFRSPSSIGNFILNQNTNAQNAKFWINGASRIDSTLTIKLPDTSATELPYQHTPSIQGIRLGTFDATVPSVNNNALISFGQHLGPGIMLVDNFTTSVDCMGIGISPYALQTYIPGPSYSAYFTWNVWGYQPVTGANEIMRLKNNGNLMLGTTTDEGFKLSVNGNSKISGSSVLGNYLVLGSLSSDPTGSNGMLYYNSTNNKFRGYQNGAWVDLIGSGGGGLGDPGINGIVARTSLNTTTARTLTGTSNKITITNGDGVSGNPIINVGSDIVQINQSNTYTAGSKQIFAANGTNADIRLTGNSSDPSSLSAGDIWYNSTSHVFKGRFNSTTRQFATLDGTETLTNKTISAASNTLTNIGLGEVVVDIITGQTQGTSPAASDEVLMSVSGSLSRVANNKLGPTQFKNIVIESPSASENLTYFYTDKAITITKVADVLRGSSSPSVTYNIRYSTARDSGSPTNVFGSNRSVTSTSGSTTTSFTNASIPAGSWVWIITSATAGTVNEASIAITYTEN